MDFFFNFSNSKKVYRMLQKGFFNDEKTRKRWEADLAIDQSVHLT